MTTDHLVGRDCPLCGASAESSQLEVKARKPAEDIGFEQLRDYFIGFRSEQCFFSYYRCQKCNLLWNPTYLSPNALMEIYSSMPPNLDVSGESDSERTQVSYAKWFRMGEKTSLTYLEVGADVGLLTRTVIQSPQVASGVAIEPNQVVHDRLLQNMITKGSIHTDLATVPTEIKFDLISMIHVLDHLPEPQTYLSELRDRSNPDVQLLIVVHNETSLLRRILRTRWAPFCLQHPQLFGPKTLATMLNSAGFQVLRHGRTKNYITPKQMASLAESIRLIPGGSSRLLPDTSLPLRLGNTATIASWHE